MRPGSTAEERAAWMDHRITGRVSGLCGDDTSVCRNGLLTAWGATQAAAEQHYDRSSDCSFTAFHGWEYTRSAGLSKVHRNVILRNEIAPDGRRRAAGPLDPAQGPLQRHRHRLSGAHNPPQLEHLERADVHRRLGQHAAGGTAHTGGAPGRDGSPGGDHAGQGRLRVPARHVGSRRRRRRVLRLREGALHRRREAARLRGGHWRRRAARPGLPVPARLRALRADRRSGPGGAPGRQPIPVRDHGLDRRPQRLPGRHR
ncbi:MAG: DUF3604 domain-containing protein [Acidobacteria bacterium]|nr:DUF3604 domain-containing protein [Acidobacteriota bacterium]